MTLKYFEYISLYCRNHSNLKWKFRIHLIFSLQIERVLHPKNHTFHKSLTQTIDFDHDETPYKTSDAQLTISDPHHTIADTHHRSFSTAHTHNTNATRSFLSIRCKFGARLSVAPARPLSANRQKAGNAPFAVDVGG